MEYLKIHKIPKIFIYKYKIVKLILQICEANNFRQLQI